MRMPIPHACQRIGSSYNSQKNRYKKTAALVATPFRQFVTLNTNKNQLDYSQHNPGNSHEKIHT